MACFVAQHRYLIIVWRPQHDMRTVCVSVCEMTTELCCGEREWCCTQSE
jgi:hypothetical protein